MFEELATQSNAPFASMAVWCAAKFNELCVKQNIKLSRSQLYRTEKAAKTMAANEDVALDAAKLAPAPIPFEVIVDKRGQLTMVFD